MAFILADALRARDCRGNQDQFGGLPSAEWTILRFIIPTKRERSSLQTPYLKDMLQNTQEGEM